MCRPCSPQRRRPLRLGTVLVSLLLVACGAAPDPVGPSGVDGLTIPTPSPDPSDFVPVVTNPWLAWGSRSRWEYATTDQRGRAATYTVVLQPDTVRIAGVETTAAEGTLMRDRTGRVLSRDTTYAAQDTEGNVWLLGRQGTSVDWRAGTNGARAGVLMPATPRVGDGFEAEDSAGEAADRLMVVAVAAEPPTSLDVPGPALLLRRTSPLTPDLVAEEYYRRGTGLVARTVDGGAGVELTLTQSSRSGE